jgi:ribosomal protein S18 acetylase RimI-like enzyme
MLIRPFREEDTEEVVALWGAAGLLRPQNDPRRDIARKLAVQRELFLVVEDGGRLVGAGMAGYEGHRGWINYLAVLPEERGRGIGRALMAEFEARLRALGCPKVSLQVREGNDDALRFYEHLGFRVDAAVSMGKRLIPDD